MCQNGIYTLPTISFVGGSTQTFEFNCYYYTNKKKFDLSACSADFSIISYVNKRGTPLVSKTMSVISDTGDNDSVSNILNVVLDPADTVDLYGKYIYQITIRDDATGVVEIPDQGILLITNNINKAYVQ